MNIGLEGAERMKQRAPYVDVCQLISPPGYSLSLPRVTRMTKADGVECRGSVTLCHGFRVANSMGNEHGASSREPPCREANGR